MLTAVVDGSWREFDIRLVYDQVWGKTGVRDAGFLFLLCLDWVMIEEGNSKQEKSDKVEFHNSTGGP